MKKILTLALLSLAFLSSCNKVSLSSSLEEDKTVLKNATLVSYSSESSFPFTIVCSYQNKETYYLFSFSLGNCTQDFSSARLLLTPDGDDYVFYGYDHDYTLVQKDKIADKSQYQYKGYSINFKLSSLPTYFEVLFSSKELVDALKYTI